MEAAPGPHGLAAAGAHGLAVRGAQGFTAGALAEQGLLAAQGLTGFAAHGFTGVFAAQGFGIAQGLAAEGDEVPKIVEAN